MTSVRKQLSVFGVSATLAVMLAWAGPAQAQASFTILHRYGDPAVDGAGGGSGLIQGPDGTLYGVTTAGGSQDRGTVFQMAPDGSAFMLLHSFIGADGRDPAAGLIQGPDGTLYGTTRLGGGGEVGTVFKVSPDGSGFMLLHSFTNQPTDGRLPLASLLQGPDGTLYGMTTSGGSANQGTIFKVAPDGSGYALLHSFTGGETDGSNPLFSGLIQGADGALYGTTSNGGPEANGTVFRIAPDGSDFAVIHAFSFSEDGTNPAADLLQDADGTLYGTTLSGKGFGTVFRLAPDGTGFMILHSFTEIEGCKPLGGLVQGPDGTLYGTTAVCGSGGRGTIFRLAPDGSGFTLLHTFDQPESGDPHGRLVQDSDGALYGTTEAAVWQLIP